MKINEIFFKKKKNNFFLKIDRKYCFFNNKNQKNIINYYNNNYIQKELNPFFQNNFEINIKDNRKVKGMFSKKKFLKEILFFTKNQLFGILIKKMMN
jgi:hypothetical protein